jgi:DNA repair protein RadA/Sms
MPKTRSKFVCQQCGYESPKWMGRCPDCGEWNSLTEVVEAPPARAGALSRGSGLGPAVAPVPLPHVEATAQERRLTGSPELDRVLGGGLVPGSLVLLGGEPGIGKSTLLAQVAGDIALRERDGSVLYVSAEESAQQVKLRADRLGIQTERLLLLAETDVQAIVDAVERVRPALVVVDSIQTVALAEVSSAPGNVSQVRESTMAFMRMAKRLQVPVFLIGHVTKEGTVAGPRALEHIVDAVLYLEGERFHTYRLLRGVKNRFGATNEVGVYEMRGEGLVDVANPSALFLAERDTHTSGSVVVVSMEGTRPLLVEVQALVTQTSFGTPRCTTNGVDTSRVQMLLAVLIKRVGLALGGQDVYLNVAGGFTLNEPAVDLGVAAAIASSFRERRVPEDVALLGEVGLGGELRAVTRLDPRLREAAKLGFRRCIVPSSGPLPEREPGGTIGAIEVVRARTLAQALEAAFG